MLMVALIVALIVLTGIEALLKNPKDLGTAIGLAFLFPCGLGFSCGPGFRGAGLAFIFISYASFIGFLIAFIRVRSWATYCLLCIGFAFLLILNIAGCRQVRKELSHIMAMSSQPNQITAANAGWSSPFRCRGSHQRSGMAEFQR